MNLETRVDQRIWDAVRANMESRNYSSAILDAIHFLSDLIRERSGLEGDGVALVGQAFGGNSPKLKVNRLQTESDQNVQKGVEALLRGIYQAIRNPRSHGAIQDDERNADAIILFLDYLLHIIDQSKAPFSLPTFVRRILDRGFVPKERYAELLVKEIPEKKRLATCREVLVRRAEADASKLRFFFECILNVMNEDEKSELFTLLSDELVETDDHATIIFILKAFPATVWPQLSEISRLRTENRLICSVKEGRWLRSTEKCIAGGLGTWAADIIDQFTLKNELWSELFRKLRATDPTEQDYVFTYFIRHVESSFSSPPFLLVMAMIRGLEAGDIRFKQVVEGWKMDGLEEREPDTPWRSKFAEALAKFEPTEESSEISDSDVPF